MSSEVASLESIQFSSYISVATAVAVLDDYILTILREVELIWMKPWSTMSTLFMVARYMGLVLAFFSGLGIVMAQLITWANVIYVVATHAIMILRVSAMFNRPKRVKYILFFLYTLIVINVIVIAFLWEGPHSGLVIQSVTLPLLNVAVCTAQFGRSKTILVYDGIPGLLFDFLLMTLVIYRFSIHAIETRKVFGRQNINKYMMLLLEHSALYFFLNLVYKGLAMVLLLVPSPSMLLQSLITLYCYTVPFMIYPRLVLSLRDHRSVSGGLYVGSEASGYLRSHGHSTSSSGPVSDNDNGDYELLGIMPVRYATELLN